MHIKTAVIEKSELLTLLEEVFDSSGSLFTRCCVCAQFQRLFHNTWKPPWGILKDFFSFFSPSLFFILLRIAGTS